MQELAHKYLKGNLNASEQLEFDQWFNEYKDEAFLVPDDVAISEQAYEQALLTKIEQQIHQAKPKTLKLWYKYAAAAVILITVALGTYFYTFNSGTHNAVQLTEIAPGRNAATLTLANGKKIRLSDATNGQLAEEAGVKIKKNAKGEIIYEVLESKALSSPPNAYNTLTTAKGETYAVVLPDGSKVWLNAASSLTYPVNFASLKERSVELIGEGYFEVAKAQSTERKGLGVRRSLPFFVKTSSQQIEVLGTHFNVNAYNDEPVVKTTLLEGSVRVAALREALKSEAEQLPNPTVILKPNQESKLINSAFKVTDVDAQESIAWKQGKFVFVNENIQSIMRKVARWYNVEVSYQSLPAYNDFSGSMSRFDNIAQVLNKIEATNKVHFKVEGRRVIVMK